MPPFPAGICLHSHCVLPASVCMHKEITSSFSLFIPTIVLPGNASCIFIALRQDSNRKHQGLCNLTHIQLHTSHVWLKVARLSFKVTKRWDSSCPNCKRILRMVGKPKETYQWPLKMASVSKTAVYSRKTNNTCTEHCVGENWDGCFVVECWSTRPGTDQRTVCYGHHDASSQRINPHTVPVTKLAMFSLWRLNMCPQYILFHLHLGLIVRESKTWDQRHNPVDHEHMFPLKENEDWWDW